MDSAESEAARAAAAAAASAAPEAAADAAFERALRLVLEETAASTGAEFFHALVRGLAATLGVDGALVGEVSGASDERIRTLAVWRDGRPLDNVDFAARGTPCELLAVQDVVTIASDAGAGLPEAHGYRNLGADAWLGATLADGSGDAAGVVAVFGAKLPRDAALATRVLGVFAPRAAAELERRHADHALLQSELRYRAIVENSFELVCEIEDDRYVYLSPGYGRTLGYEPEALLGASGTALVHPDDLKRVREEIRDGVALGRAVRFTYRCRHASGEWRWFESVANGLRGPDGAHRIVIMSRDVTEKIEAARLLTESEHRHRAIVEHSTQLLCELSAGELTYIAPNFRGALGYEPDEMIGRRLRAFIHPNECDDFDSMLDAADQTETTFRIRHADTTWHWFEMAARRYETPAGEARTVIVARDVTERRRAASALRSSEARFEALMGRSSDVLVELVAGQIVYLSPNVEKVSGLRMADVLGRPVIELVHPDDLAKLADVWVEEGEQTLRANLRVRRGDDEWLWFEANMVRSAHPGEPSHVIAMLRELAPEQQQRAALRDADSRFRALMEQSSDVLVELLEGTLVYVSPNSMHMAGMTPEQVLGRNFQELIHHDDLPALAKYAAPGFEGEILAEMRIKDADGVWRWREARGTRSHTADGRPNAIVILRDIDERKQDSRVLEQMETRLRTVVDNAPLILFAIDRDGIVTLSEGRGLHLLDRRRGDIVGKHIGDVYPDAPEIAGYVERALEGETVQATVRLRGMTFDGHYTPLVDDAGVVSGVIGVAVDISERDQAEEHLRRYAKEMETLNAHLAASQEALSLKSRQLELALATETERARRDTLTGALNHGAIVEAIEEASSGEGAHCAAAMVDVDGMKAVNDTYGHNVGDLVLLRIMEALSRPGAEPGRYGGDEFLVLLPGADRAAAEAYAHDVLASLEGAHVIDDDSGASVPVVASIGVAVFPDDAVEAASLIEAADEAMYSDKKARTADGAQGLRLASSRSMGDERAASMVGELVPLLTSAAPLQEKLRLVSHRLTLGTEYDAVNIEVFDTQQDSELVAQEVFARAPEELLNEWREGQRNQQDHPIGAILEQTRKPLILDDLATDDRITEPQRRLLTAIHICSAIVVPMIADDVIVGTMSVGSTRERFFGPKDARFLSAVATQVTAIVRMSQLVDELREASTSLAEARAETIMLLATTADPYDESAGDHLQTVRGLTEALALDLGYTQDQARELGLAATLHDIGNVRLPEALLRTSGVLTDEQRSEMQRHAAWGEEILSQRPGFRTAAIVARHHHERWDGAGYPDGLAGVEIPEAAAIVTVVDSFDAMLSDRPYRTRKSVQRALDEIAACSGSQFSPRVVDALLRLHGREPLAQKDEPAA